MGLMQIKSFPTIFFSLAFFYKKLSQLQKSDEVGVLQLPRLVLSGWAKELDSPCRSGESPFFQKGVLQRAARSK